ncbi:MAG TPA: bifunctional serine/threonine-protein kinase/formylglycine-generating enzyme family protein [Thermoanaerobaculia bacterium]|nr:bifunctional serine/threonine-protein kinase/formylglycine-generating enzyme family protein [Thermoanaerobaculia bacterium]
MTIPTGTRLGPYEILSPLGAGGMGEVYRARDTRLAREVAVKVLPASRARDPDALARMEREAQAIAALSHPNILAIHDLGTDGGVFYVVTELLEGETLRTRLASSGLPWRKSVEIAAAIADGLAGAHLKGIVHRDLKPDNVFLTRDGRVKILDFGLARLQPAVAQQDQTSAPTTPPQTEPGLLMGTVGYMSPEQARGASADTRSDIFALGCVIYEMLTGRRAFSRPTAPETLTAILNEDPPNVSESGKVVPVGLTRLLRRCLEKNPEERLQASRDLAFDLRSILSDSEIEKTSSGFGANASVPVSPRAARRTQEGVADRLQERAVSLRGKRALLLGGAAILILLAAAGLFLRRTRETARFRAMTAGLESAAAAGRLDEVFALLQEKGLELGDPRLAALAGKVGGTLSLATDPAGAAVSVTRAQPVAGFDSRRPVAIGRAPVTARLVGGEYLVRLEAGGMNPVAFLQSVEAGKELRITRKLIPTTLATEGMEFVEEGKSAVSPDGAAVPAFLIDKNEVPSSQFLKFIAAGGYRDQTFWPETLIVNGKPAPWSAAVKTFVDRTGLPGPRSWSGGTFPEGKGDHPVVGVSWYEVTAYGRWLGKELPTREQWWRAAIGETRWAFPWGNDVKTAESRANFGLVGTRPVGSYPLGVSPFGCFDMAGNVREWLREPASDPSLRSVVGGSWEDPAYMFESSHTETFEPAFANNSIGFRLVRPVPGR